MLYVRRLVSISLPEKSWCDISHADAAAQFHISPPMFSYLLALMVAYSLDESGKLPCRDIWDAWRDLRKKTGLVSHSNIWDYSWELAGSLWII